MRSPTGKPHPLRATALLVLFLVTGCAASASEEDPFSRSRAGAEPGTLLVTIDNQNFNDATIYALWDGRARQRVGWVTGRTSETFELDYQSDGLRFEVDFLAGGEFIGDRIIVSPGDHLEFRLPSGG